MGKKNFKKFYKKIQEEMNGEFGKVTAKISYFSDKFEPGKNYAGAIIYSVNGKFQWENIGGEAKGWDGRSFYIIIKCTDDWGSEQYNRAGQGMVHDYLTKKVLGIDYKTTNKNDKRLICAGGFAYYEGKLKFNSWWLNSCKDGNKQPQGCDNDEEKSLSQRERVLVKYCVKKWKNNGVHKIFEIPEELDNQLDGTVELIEVPSREGCRI